MTLRPQYISGFILAAIVLSLAVLPATSFAAVTCVNGQLVADDGSVTGTCNGTGATGATDDNTTTGTGTADYSGTYAYQKDGVFGCNLNGAYSMSVGALSATGGAYVPVNDASVTLNTGYLVYKECVLRGIVDRQREGVTSSFQKKIISTYLTGNNGKPYFSQNLNAEGRAVYDNSIIIKDLSGNTLNSIEDPVVRAATKRAIAQGYAQARNNPTAVLSCGASANQSFWKGLLSLQNPACTAYGAFRLSNDLVMQNAASAWNNQLTQLSWYNGNYGTQIYDEDGNLITVTPGSIIGSNVQQALQTGFRQLENANDIDQMVGALFAGITSQLISDSKGLVGLTQRAGSQPSYLDKVASESAAGIRSSALNAAIAILGATRQNEQTYLSAMQAIGTVLTNTINALRERENTCWKAVIQNVCVAGSLKPDNTCTAVSQACTPGAEGTPTCPPEVKLQIATSTAFSQAIVTGRITPLANSTLANIETSSSTLAIINRLFAGVTNTTSLSVQRLALQELDPLVAQRKLHTQYDAQTALQSKTDVTNSMTTLISDTVANWTGRGTDGSTDYPWDGTTYPAVGWCNVSNPSTIQAWITKWKK